MLIATFKRRRQTVEGEGLQPRLDELLSIGAHELERPKNSPCRHRRAFASGRVDPLEDALLRLRVAVMVTAGGLLTCGSGFRVQVGEPN
jgi:hypothetical protein